MKIVIVGSYPLDSNHIGGGVEASVYGLAHELARTHDVVVYDMPRKGGADIRQSEGDLLIERVSNPGSFNLSGSRCLSAMVGKIKADCPDVCHVHGTGLLSFNLFKKMNEAGIPVLLTVHGLASVEKKKALRKQFSVRKWLQYLYQSLVEFRFISACTKIVVDSEYVKTKLESLNSSGKIRHLPEITIIPQGISQEYYQVDAAHDTCNVLSVGGFASRKGHLYLLRAFEKVAEAIPEVILTIAGTLSSKAYYQEMMGVVESLSCHDRIRLMPDLDKDSLIKLYSEARVFALHSQEESQGIVFAEAMAAGIPVVATNVGGIPFVVEDGKSGLLTAYSDTDSFASAMKDLLLDKQKWISMSLRAKELSSRYDWRIIASEIEAVYEKLILE